MKPLIVSLSRVLLLALVLLGCAGWLDNVRDRAASGNRLYFRGKYEQAEKTYGQGLVDYPASDILHFNMAAAQYQQGKYSEALQALDKVRVEDTGPLAAKVAYNRANARFKLARNSEEADPQVAIGLYGQALVSYRRAMSLDPADIDAKFNHELAEKRIADLKKTLEEEKKKKEEEEQESKPEKSDDQQEKKSGEEQDQGKQPEQKQKQQKQQEQQEGGGQAEEEQVGGEGEPEPSGSAGAGEQRGPGGEMSPQEARALVEAAKGEEMEPGEVSRRILGVGGLGQPMRDW